MIARRGAACRSPLAMLLRSDRSDSRFSSRHYPDAHASEAVISSYARLDQESRSVGRRMGKNDLWIAAVAAVQSATIVTTDQDFDHLSPNWVKVERIDVATLLAPSST